MNRKIAPSIKNAVDYTLTLKPYEKRTLRNGVDVYSVQAGAQEVVQIEFVFYAGNAYEQQKGIAGATNFLLKNGTTNKTAFQINEAFDFFGAFCSRACYNETSVITLHSLVKHTEKVLPVVREMLTDAVFPEEELAIYKQNTIQRMKVNLQKADYVAGRLIDSYVFGEQHPYGVYSNPEDVSAIEIEACRTFYQQHYLKGNCIIFVAGNFSDGLLDKLEDYFGDLNLSSKGIVIPQQKLMPAVQKQYRIENDANAVQGAIRLASPFPNRHHEDFKKVMVLNSLFGGFFGSRLMSNIREDKGYTYGIYSYLQNHIQESAWVISTEAGKDVSEATVQEVFKEMKNLREEEVSEDELMLVRNYMLGGILGDLDGPFQIMAKWKNMILNGLDESYFYDSVQEIKNITASELKQLAIKYLQPERFYDLIVY